MRMRFAAAVMCGCLAATAPAVIPALAGASGARTQATVFEAFTSAGKPTFSTHSVKGYCWTGSIAANRSDAWRCFVGNVIYDPCFSSPLDPGYAACPYTSLRRGILIKLTKKLPRKFADHHKASVSDRPWLIQTLSGRRWLYASGATTVISGHRANYFRRGSTAALWGLPNRKVEPWRIYWAPLSATKLTERVGIRHAWM